MLIDNVMLTEGQKHGTAAGQSVACSFASKFSAMLLLNELQPLLKFYTIINIKAQLMIFPWE